MQTHAANLRKIVQN